MVLIIAYIVFVVSKIKRKVLNELQEANQCGVVAESENVKEAVISVTDSRRVREPQDNDRS